MGAYQTVKAFTSIALTAKVAMSVAFRPCGWGWISICLEVALTIQAKLESSNKFR